MSEQKKSPSSIIWKGYSEELQLNLTVLFAAADDLYIYTIVQLDLVTGEHDATIEARWRKETMSEAIESGAFIDGIVNTYMNVQIANYKDYCLMEYRVN